MSSALEPRVDELGHRFTVSRARGREALSRTYWFDVSLVTTRRSPLEGRSLVGHAATLVIPSDGESARKIRGVIASQRVDGHAAPGDAQQFRVRVVPGIGKPMGSRTRHPLARRMLFAASRPPAVRGRTGGCVYTCWMTRSVTVVIGG